MDGSLSHPLSKLGSSSLPRFLDLEVKLIDWDIVLIRVRHNVNIPNAFFKAMCFRGKF